MIRVRDIWRCVWWWGLGLLILAAPTLLIWSATGEWPW